MDKAARLNADQRDDLVAYLDGELPEGDSQQIDQLLARSEVARHEVEALARTWEMLDLLSKPNATEGFTDRTLTTLKVSELPRNFADQPWVAKVRKAALIATWVLVLSASAWGGYYLSTRVIPNPEAEMLARLPLLRNLDLYLELNDLEFINALKRQTDLAGAAPESGGSSSGRRLATSMVGNVSAQVLEQRFQDAAQLPQPERDRIMRNEAEFERLPPERQAALMELHRQVSAEPESVHAMLETYAMWLQTLSPGQRDDLRKAKNSGSRIDLVRRFKAEQDASRETQLFDLNIDLRRGFGSRWNFPTLNPDDLAIVMEAVKKELDLYDQQRIDALPAAGEKYVTIIRTVLEPGRGRPLNDESVQRIIDAVPDENIKRSILRSSDAGDRRRELMRRITFSTSSMLAEEMKQFMPTEKDLQELFVSDKISGDTRYELMQMSPRELTMELVRRYLEETEDPRVERVESLRRQLREILFREGSQLFGPRRGPGPGRGDDRERSEERGPDRRDFGPRGSRDRGPDGPPRNERSPF